MKICRDHDLRSSTWGRRYWTHKWAQWQPPIKATYKGVETLVQIRECKRCNKTQAREC